MAFAPLFATSVLGLTLPVLGCWGQEPDFCRLPPRPAWELNLTAQAQLLPGEPATVAAALASAGLPFAVAMDRARRAADTALTGQTRWWRVPVALPEAARAAAWPVVLDLDESRVVESAWCDSDRLPAASVYGSLWCGGEGSYLLPLSAARPTATAVLRTRQLTHQYPDGFGQIRLRPATLNEVLKLTQQGYRCTLRNLSGLPVAGTIHVRAEDYFGVELGRKDSPFQVAPESRFDFALDQVEGVYKTRVWMSTADGKATWDHWLLEDPERENRTRPEVLRLVAGWEYAWAPADQPADLVPAAGWKPAKLPHRPQGEEYKSHRMWYRTTLEVPAAWSGRRLQFYLPRVLYKADIFLDGSRLTERCEWDLPAAIDLPAVLAPGEKHQLVLAVTDWTVGLAPGIAVPAPGTRDLPMRARMGTITDLAIGLDTVPELLGVPPVRTEWAAIRPQLGPEGASLNASLELVNALSQAQEVVLRAAVLARGQEVLRLPDRKLTLAPGANRTELAQAWPKPILWTPENPFLYELRLELRDAASQTLDLRRERFGCRTFGSRDGYFTLNGERLNLPGGSHVMLQNLVWPMRPHPYRLVRHSADGVPNAFGSGRIVEHLGDEMGILLKGETLFMNSLHSDTYAWQRPELWERYYRHMAAVIRSQVNHPSVVFWDVGNELIYKGPGEADRMGELFAKLRTLDPTRLATTGGSVPVPTGAEVVDYHGWGEWATLKDRFFMQPEKRPDYLRGEGLYQHRPADEDPARWQEKYDIQGWQLTREMGLVHLGGKPVLFSEGHYYENGVLPELFGNDAFVGLPTPGQHSGWDFDNALHYPQWLQRRMVSVQNVRQAGYPSSMIHVDRGVGRNILPLAAFALDRRFRFASGERLQSAWTVHNDLSYADTIHARYRLWDGEKLLGEQSFDQAMPRAAMANVALDLALPPAPERDLTLRLEVQVWAEHSPGRFFADHDIAVFAPAPARLPEGLVLDVFDPAGRVLPFLEKAGVPLRRIEALTAWPAGQPLLVGSEGLARADGAALKHLREQILKGGQAIVLDHREMPAFLPHPLAFARDSGVACTRQDPFSPVTRGLLNEDLRFWQTSQNDQIAWFSAPDTPANGNFRVHVAAYRKAPVLELAEGQGRVLFCQLNLQDALGRDPAAARLLANLLQWYACPPPSAGARVQLLAGDARFVSIMQRRFGYSAPVSGQLDSAVLKRLDTLVIEGTDAAAREALGTRQQVLLAFLEGGGCLLVCGLDEEGAAWLAKLLDRRVSIRNFPYDRAWLLQYRSELAGMAHGDFHWQGRVLNNVEVEKPQAPADGSVGCLALGGEDFRPWLRPAYLGDIRYGQGRVVISTLRALDYPTTAASRALAQVLSNLGVPLIAGGLPEPDNTAAWRFQPIDLARFVNWPTLDSDTGRRGWTMAGEHRDFRDFPVGEQTFKGIRYRIPDPARCGGNGCIGLALTKGTDVLPRELKGIPVNAKADRLFFLHTSAWGVPGLVYRVTYLEDRKAWIPGKPDPWVDIVVKPKEHLQDWWFAGQVECGDLFMADATVAWKSSRQLDNGAEGRGFGVYQMAWDNPHPEKVIESIDLLCPGMMGSGQAFVLGITAATRLDKPQALRAPLKSVLPPGVDPRAVAAQLECERYGLVLLKSGAIAVIYDVQGKPLLKYDGWLCQGSMLGADDRPQYTHEGWQPDDSTMPPKTSVDDAGNRVYEIPIHDKGGFKWGQKLTLAPTGPRVEMSVGVLAGGPAGVTRAFYATVGALGDTRFTGIAPNAVPVMYDSPGGKGSVSFAEAYRRWYTGYSADAKGVRWFVQNGRTLEPGRLYTLGFEINVP